MISSKFYRLDLGQSRSLLGMQDVKHLKVPETVNHVGGPGWNWRSAGLMATGQYSEGPATGHLDTGFFLVSLRPKANAEMATKVPSCHYMLLM